MALSSVVVNFGAARSITVRERWAIWHITRNCNLACSYCYGSFDGGSYKSLGVHPEELGTVRAGRVFFELAEAGFDAVHINGGEPLLRNDIVEVLRSGRPAGVRTWLLTNGTIRGRRLEALISENLVDLLAVSLDTFQPRLGDLSRERTERVIGTLRDLVDRRSREGSSCKIGVYVVASRPVVVGFPAFAEWLIDLGVDYVNVQPVFLPSGHDRSDLVLGEKDRDVVQSFYDRLAESGLTTSSEDMQWLALATLDGAKGVASDCFADRGDYYYISYDGLVYGCPVKGGPGRSIAKGSLHNSEFANIAQPRSTVSECRHLCGDCLGMYEMATGGNARATALGSERGQPT